MDSFLIDCCSVLFFRAYETSLLVDQDISSEIPYNGTYSCDLSVYDLLRFSIKVVLKKETKKQYTKVFTTDNHNVPNTTMNQSELTVKLCSRGQAQETCNPAL